MKKIYQISIVLLALSGISCNRLVDYTEVPFVYFPSPSLSVYEDAGVVEIPVKANADVDFSLTFETEDGVKTDATTGLSVPNGQKGVDYDIVDNDAAIIRFAAGETDKTIKVSIVNFAGVLTGNKDFTIKMTGSGNEVSRGGYSSCKVTIIDNDHPLKSIFGEYAATDASGAAWTMTLAADPDNWYTTFIDGIVPTFAGSYVGQGNRHYVPASVSEDLSTITVNLGYKLADPYNDNDITIFGYDGQYIYGSGSVAFEKTETGYKLDGTKGFAAIYENGGYYLAASNAMVTAPITLVKK
ncbi:MAG: hypothetical protein J6W09_01685 [Bacteroidales bacterium]|nr:hypothetical protein [Bacteroidales bacterium]